MKIKRPTSRDGVMNPPSFFSKKGSVGTNIQVIVDKNKRILSNTYQAVRGTEYDSTALKNTPLYQNIVAEKSFYHIGDLAYSLMSLIFPFLDDVMHKTAGYTFNLFSLIQ